MAMNSIKIKATEKDGAVEVKVLVKHAMETGLRKDSKTGQLVPAHFIKEVTCEHNNSVVFVANWAIAVSKNPYLSFKIKHGVSGDVVRISWIDNMGDSDSAEATVV